MACKGIYHPIKSSGDYNVYASALAFDAGFQYRSRGAQFIVGAALQNAGFLVSNYSRDFTELQLPLAVTVGFSYMPLYIPALRIACDLQKANDDYLNYKPGFEWAIYKKNLFFRGGYGFSEADLEYIIKQMKNEAPASYVKSNAAGFSLGFGIVTDINGMATNLDVACLLRSEDLGPSLALSMLVEY